MPDFQPESHEISAPEANFLNPNHTITRAKNSATKCFEEKVGRTAGNIWGFKFEEEWMGAPES